MLQLNRHTLSWGTSEALKVLFLWVGYMQDEGEFYLSCSLGPPKQATCCLFCLLCCILRVMVVLIEPGMSCCPVHTRLL